MSVRSKITELAQPMISIMLRGGPRFAGIEKGLESTDGIAQILHRGRVGESDKSGSSKARSVRGDGVRFLHHKVSNIVGGAKRIVQHFANVNECIERAFRHLTFETIDII